METSRAVRRLLLYRLAGLLAAARRAILSLHSQRIELMLLRRFLCALVLGIGCCVAAGQAHAQTAAPTAARKGVQPKPRVTPKGETMKEGFMMKDKRVLMTRSGLTAPLQTDETLPSGVKVAANGAVTMTDGRTVQLQEGDYLSPTGRLTTLAMRTEQDSLQRLNMEKSKGKKGKRN